MEREWGGQRDREKERQTYRHTGRVEERERDKVGEREWERECVGERENWRRERVVVR